MSQALLKHGDGCVNNTNHHIDVISGKEAEGDNKDQRYQILHSFFILNLGATLC